MAAGNTFKKAPVGDKFAAYVKYIHKTEDKKYERWIQCCAPGTEAEVDSFIAAAPGVTFQPLPQQGFKQVVNLHCAGYSETLTFVL